MAVKKDKKQNADEQNQKHDKGYKGILSDNAVFLHFLKKYFATTTWTANISADDMERIDKSFIDREYRKTDSDLIYRLKIKDVDVYFYVLLELQSKVDFTMPFRLLRYMVELLNDVFKNTDKNVRKRRNFRMPVIVPIILYVGKGKWTPAMTYREYTEGCGGIFGDYIINFRYYLCDLNRLGDEEIEPVEDPLDAIFTVEKLRINKNLTSDRFAEWWINELSGLSESDRKKLKDWVEHIQFNGKIPPDMEKMLEHNIKKGDIVKMKSLADVWKADARRQGRLEGRLEGRREGRLEGVLVGEREGMSKGEKRKALAIAQTMKDRGMDVNTISELTDLTIDDVLRL